MATRRRLYGLCNGEPLTVEPRRTVDVQWRPHRLTRVTHLIASAPTSHLFDVVEVTCGPDVIAHSIAAGAWPSAMLELGEGDREHWQSVCIPLETSTLQPGMEFRVRVKAIAQHFDTRLELSVLVDEWYHE